MTSYTEQCTYEEFLETTKDVERVEFIDGEIHFMSPPSFQHQIITRKLMGILSQYFEGKKCEPINAPFDVEFERESNECKHQIVQPDIVVICDTENINGEGKYKGIPTLIVEITSPSEESHDTIKKFNLYERFKVPEYWIVSPKNKIVTVYKYENSINVYGDSTVYSKNDVARSEIFKELSIELDKIF